MNKQELIDCCNAIKENKSQIINCIDVNGIIKKIEQLDEPEKVKVPQFVAEWIETAKKATYNIRGAIEMAPKGRIEDWLELKNVDTFAEAWVNGYIVEKQKRYIVSLKNGQPLVKAPLGKKFYFNQNITAGNYKATREELEEADFGWVFDCEGIEIKEVEE